LLSSDKTLESNPDIDKVYYWDRDNTSNETIIEYMERAVLESDIIINICSKASKDSSSVQKELDLAIYKNKIIGL